MRDIFPSSNGCGVCSSTHAHASRYTEIETRWDNRGRGKAGVPIFDGAWGRKCSNEGVACPHLNIFAPSPLSRSCMRTQTTLTQSMRRAQMRSLRVHIALKEYKPANVLRHGSIVPPPSLRAFLPRAERAVLLASCRTDFPPLKKVCFLHSHNQAENSTHREPGTGGGIRHSRTTPVST